MLKNRFFLLIIICLLGCASCSKYRKLLKSTDNEAKLKAALAESLVLDEITPEKITEIALRHNICPHEFMIDTMEFCTVMRAMSAFVAARR